MALRPVQLFLAAAFAAATGHLAWQTLLGPPTQPDYWMSGEATLSTADPSAKHLYLRRRLYLPQRPEHAWLQVIGRDHIRIYVNGSFVAEEILLGFPVGVSADITPFLRPGPNVIAINAAQATIGAPPMIAVRGACLVSGRDYPIGADDQWRTSAVFERRAFWWFAPEFDDGGWERACVGRQTVWAKVMVPPRAVIEPPLGEWISGAVPGEVAVSLRHEFDVAGRPRQAWLRVTATGCYRLAVNGILLDEQEAMLGTTLPAPPVERAYDLIPLVQSGRNVVTLALTATTGRPHVRADAEVEDGWGRRYRFGTDGHWQARPGLAGDWLKSSVDHPDEWHDCGAEPTAVGVLPWEPRRETVTLILPWSVRATRSLGQGLVVTLVFLLTLVACRRAVRWLVGRAVVPAARHGVYLALLVPALALGGAFLASHDPRVSRQAVYHPAWLILACGLVLLQWVLLRQGLSGDLAGPSLGASLKELASSRRAAYWLLAALILVGFWLRIRDIRTEPMHWDEIENYRATRGFLERGFPNCEIHKDLPRMYIHTSELFFVPPALMALLVKDPCYIMRFPGVCWGTLTIGLVYLTGRRLFGQSAGLIAAATYALAPVCIMMSTFGRYFSQLQFCTLLSVYFFWLTVRGAGPINRRALWLTVASFVAMYLTWEPSVLLAPGMMLAALIQRRGRLRTLLADLHTWRGMLIVLLVIGLQYSHMTLQHTHFLWYGISHSDASLKLLWDYPVFQPWYYVWESSWNQDALLPVLGLVGAGLLALAHGQRRPLRLLLIIHLMTCFVMSSLLSALAWRYIHHLIPLTILLGSAACAAALRFLIQLRACPTRARIQAAVTGVAASVVVVGLGSGMTIRTPSLDAFRIEAYPSYGVFKWPNFGGPAEFLKQHLRPGDILLASDPQHVHGLMGRWERPDWPNDYWPASTLSLPATLDDRRSLPLDRRDGTKMISDRQSMEALFARHERIWYVVQPGVHSRQNEKEVSAFLRQHMDVVYEDFEAMVFFRGQHRTAALRRQNEDALRAAQATFNLLY